MECPAAWLEREGPAQRPGDGRPRSGSLQGPRESTLDTAPSPRLLKSGPAGRWSDSTEPGREAGNRAQRPELGPLPHPYLPWRGRFARMPAHLAGITSPAWSLCSWSPAPVRSRFRWAARPRGSAGSTPRGCCACCARRPRTERHRSGRSKDNARRARAPNEAQRRFDHSNNAFAESPPP